MCKWKVNRCECPVSYCTEGLEQLGSLEVEYYFSVPEKHAIPILETVCKAVECGLEIEDGAMCRDLFKNVSVFFFKTMSLASDKEVFRLVLPDWEGEYPWEIYSGISQKAHFKRQIKFETDKVFCLVVSADDVQDKETLSNFSEYEGMYILPFLYYVSEYLAIEFNADYFEYLFNHFCIEGITIKTGEVFFRSCISFVVKADSDDGLKALWDKLYEFFRK